MSTDTGRVIVISGGICSGKSAVARCLSEKLNCPVGSFGMAVRSIATSRGIEHKRSNLQTLGKQLVESTPEELCQVMLELASWTQSTDLIVEGMRHTHVMDLLRRMVLPSTSYLVFLNVPRLIRQERLILRDGKGDLQDLEKHSTERQVLTVLCKAADHILDGDQSTEAVCNDILGLMH